MRATSQMRWEMKTIETRRDFSCRIAAKSASTWWKSSEAVGSSRMRMRGSLASALAISTSCFSSGAKFLTRSRTGMPQPMAATACSACRTAERLSRKENLPVRSRPRATFSQMVISGTRLRF
jgi:hypothetical protein